MKTVTKLFIGFLLLTQLTSIGFILYLKYEEKNREKSLSSLVKDQGQNQFIQKYVKDSITHTIYQDRIINDSETEKRLALGTYGDTLQKALKASIDKINQVTRINADLKAQVALKTNDTPSGKTIKTHKDEYLDLMYFPETDSLKMAYNIKLNDARYSERKWLLGTKHNYINLYSDDKRITINGVKSYRIKEAPPNRFGLGFSAGYGLGKDDSEIKLIPYVGLSLNYNLLEF